MMKVLSALISILIFFIPISSEGSAAGVTMKEKFASGSNAYAEEYLRFLKYPFYSEMLESNEKNGYEPAKGVPVIQEAVNTRLENSDQLRLEFNIGESITSSFVWDEEVEWAEWEFNVSAEGLYNIEVEYYMLPGSGNSAVRSLMLDGIVPFMEASNLVFPRKWKDAGEPVVNSLGDETRPSQVEVSAWTKQKLIDDTGLYFEPFHFYLKPGQHTVRLEFVDQQMVISQIALVPSEVVPAYNEVADHYVQMGYQEATSSIQFEAELNAVEKSDPTIRRESSSDPSVSPPSYKNRKLNALGGWAWRRGNQAVTWEFSVPEDGLYKIGIRELQLWNDGLPSFRQISIDGIVPFKEMQEYRFPYGKKWNLDTLRDDNDEPFLFYLSKGTHQLTMTVKLGPLAPVLQSLNEDTLLLSNMIRDIIKVTGTIPDVNYDYEFFKTIPTLRENMEFLIHSLQDKYDRIKNVSDKLPAMANNFLTIKSQLTAMVNNPFSIANKVDDLNNAQGSLGTWYLALQTQPLMVDYFKIGAPDEKWTNKQANLFQKTRFMFADFMTSFTKNYNDVGSVLSDDTPINSSINVWIARGTEWAEIIKEMADEQFTPRTGILVNVNVLPAGQLQAGSVNALMLSIASGKAPDIGLGVDAGSPVEFAIRDAVVDLSKFEDFDEIAERFIPSIMVPFQYRGGVYALPETMDFGAIFYRKDILQELAINIPNTREELYNFTLPALYQNGLQFYYPSEFSQFMFQHGGDYYTPDGMRSGLDTPEAFRAFQEYTELFTNYGMPVAADFYNRMRSGEMPIGIGTFGTYLQLSVAAPELAGRWGIAPLPGTKTLDGTIDRSNGIISGQSMVILNQSEQQEQSWEFMKWWTSTDVQTNFARELEALIGVEARWNSANIEAFSNLSWRKQDLEVIKEQWKWAREIPVVLGGYYTGRYISNAWTTVVVNNGNVRDALEQAVKEINRELRMKQEEYGVFDSQR